MITAILRALGKKRRVKGAELMRGTRQILSTTDVFVSLLFHYEILDSARGGSFLFVSKFNRKTPK